MDEFEFKKYDIWLIKVLGYTSPHSEQLDRVELVYRG